MTVLYFDLDKDYFKCLIKDNREVYKSIKNKNINKNDLP